LSLIAYGVIAAAGSSLELFVYVSTGLVLTKSGLSFYSVRKQIPPRLRWHFAALKQSLLYGLALYVGLAINSLHFRVNQFFIDSMLGSAELGYFALSVRIAEFVWLTDYVVVTASLYRVTSENFANAVLVTQRTLKLVAVLVLFFSLAIFALAPIVVPLLFGTAFEPAILPLWFLLPGIVAWSLGRSLSPFISYQCGKPWYNTATAAVAFAINLVANGLLIPRLGTTGAAIASSISYTFNLLVILMIFLRLSGARLADTFLPSKEEVGLVVQLLKEKYQEYRSRAA
jgi:O-antigen/teichoic acid export membrane protein